MQTATEGYNSLNVLMQLNRDRLLYISAVVVALLGGAALGSLMI